MPYKIDPKNKKCVVKADTGKRVGCTKGSVKKYLAALHINVNESEEFNPEDFGWAEEILKSDVIDITGRTSLLRSLPEGSLLTITGEYEGMVFSEEKVVIIRKQDVTYTNSLATYLLKFDDVIEGDNGTTHCGENKFDRSKCDCIRTRTDYEDDLGKCWWVNLKQMDEVLLIFDKKPNQLSESEEFDWVYDVLDTGVDLSNNTFLLFVIQELLKNSNFKIVKTGSAYEIEDEYGDVYVYIPKENFNLQFIYDDIKDNLQLLKADGNNEMLPYHQKLMSLFNTTNINRVIKNLRPINESEEFNGENFDWSDFDYGSIALGDLWENNLLNVGDIVTITGDVYDNVKILTTFNKELFKVFKIHKDEEGIISIKFKWIGDDFKKKPDDWDDVLDYNNCLTVDGDIGSDFKLKIELVTKSLNESEDEFGWAEDLLENPFLNFTGKEILIDVRDFTEEQLFELSDILKPFIDFEYGSQHHGDWSPKCITNKHNIKSVSLHCGTEDFDYKPQKGHVCCLNSTYEEEPSYTKSNIIPVDGKNLLSSYNLNEAEEIDSDNFGWAEDIIYGDDVPINIKGKEDFLKNLKPGSVLKISGSHDDLFFEDQKVEIISDFPSSIGGTINLKLVKFNYFLATSWDSDLEGTHCGGMSANSEVKSKCGCIEDGPEVNGDMGVGKCWWVDLLNSVDEIYLYPSPSKGNITENKKPLLKEGRYDKITSDVVRDIMELVKNNEEGYFYLPNNIENELYYEQEGLSFDVELSIEKTEDPITFEIDSVILGDEEYDDEEYDDEGDNEGNNVIRISILLGRNFSTQNLQKLYYKLQEDVRHEIEHFTQEGPDRIEDRPMSKEKTSELPPLEHHTHITEIPALVHGFYRRSKLEKRPLDEIMVEDLDDDISKGNLTKEQASQILNLWIDYAKKHLPHAQYSGEY